MTNATRDDLNSLDYHLDNIREELLKWCVMPLYMTRDGREDFDIILRGVCNIAELCKQFSISEEYIYEYFKYKTDPKLLQMLADYISIDFRESKIDISEVWDPLMEVYMAIVRCATECNSLLDLLPELEKFAAIMRN